MENEKNGELKRYAQIAEAAYKNNYTFANELRTITKVMMITDAITDAQMYILLEPRRLTFVFRGTQSTEDRVIDLQTNKKLFPWTNGMSSACWVHAGFLEQFQSLRPFIQNAIEENDTIQTITCVGHSLGGALASLAAVYIKSYWYLHTIVSCYTFGSPRVGNKKFASLFDRIVDKSVRVVNGYDIVPRLPKLFYQHVKGKQIVGKNVSLAERLLGSFDDHRTTMYCKNC